MRRFAGMAGLVTGLLILVSSFSWSQGLYPVSQEEKFNRSSLIVEGKVISKSAAWNSTRSMIYTTSKVEVYKVFKGSLEKNIIDVVTVGGAVDNYYIHASHLLELQEEDLGVFFLNRRINPATRSSVFDVYSSSQGFIKYDLYSKTAATPFVQYSDIEGLLYKELRNKSGRKPEIKNRYFNINTETQKLQSNNSTLAPVITSFSPATVNSGALLDPTNNLLTINGTGFGTKTGSAAVLFSHSDFAAGTQFVAISHTSPLVVSWSSTEIKIRVPTQAGSGVFRVRDNTGAEVTSPSNLQVRFSVLTADFGGSYGIKQFNLGNMNTTGGYSIKYSTSTANSGTNINASAAKATFQRALTTWKESVGVNFIEAGNSTLQTVDPDDGENMVMYDNGGTGLDAPLADGVLATCFSGITICTNNPAGNQARKTGFDIVIRNTGYSSGNTPFTLGPCPPYSGSTSVVDLESVLLHEIGHALNLGHIVDPLQGAGAGTATPAKVMHYSVSFNQRRISLDYAAREGGLYQVTPHAHTYGNCVIGDPEMLPLDIIVEPKDECPANFPVVSTPMFSTINFDLAHATSNKFVDPSYLQMKTDGTGTNVTNTAFYAFRTGENGGDLALEVLNYVTIPEDIEECPKGSTGIDVTGVKLSLYKVNSCPDGGDYPTPLAYRTFGSNSVLQTISGLNANSNYLIVADGIQNTKAVFDLVFAGSALPSLSTELVGEIIENYNRLAWTTDPSFDVTTMVLERSADGVTFEEIQEITGAAQDAGEYADMSPLPGTNYYRLRVENASGNIQYSVVVLLNRTDDFQVNVFPNPAGPLMNVEILSFENGRYGISVYNSFGQRVMQKIINVTNRRHIEAIQSSAFMSGIYYVTVYDKNNKRLKSATIKVSR